MKIKLISVFLVLLIAVLFCACGKADNSVTEGTTAASESDVISADSAPVASATDSEVAETEPTADSKTEQADENVTESESKAESGADVPADTSENTAQTETYQGEPEVDFADLM